jgi:hypothetical protein
MPLAAPRLRVLPKASPESDPRFRKVMDQLHHGAARTRAHPSAAKKAAEASAAAKGPSNEKAAGAKAKQVDKIQEAPAKKPETQTFLALLRAEIQNAMPKNLGETENFMKGGSSAELKGSLKGNVSQKKDEATADVKTASKEAPKESGVPTKEAKPIPAEPAPAAPAVSAPEGMPAAKSDAEVSLQDSKQDTDAQMKEAEVTPQQLQNANDPRFSAVLTAKDAVGKQADAAPGQYRAAERGVQAQGAAGATAAAHRGTVAMLGVRGGANSAVLAKQALAKAKEEAERKQVTDHIEAIYNRTKTSVEQKLSTLETEVGSIFDTGIDAALKGMTDYIDARLTRWKLERYLGSPIGLLLWAKDKLKGLPPEVNVIYEAGRKLFTGLMDTLVVRVAALVEGRLKEAKAEVARGQAEIKSYVDGLSPHLRAVGLAAQKDVAGRFEQLEAGIEEKKNQLAQQLAQKYKEAFDKANESLKKIQDENKGLINAFMEKLGAVIKALTEFKEKLMSVFKKGKDTINLILAHPIQFFKNLGAAIKKGIGGFVDRIWEHLKKGFLTWMFGTLADAGIEVPSDFGLPSLLKLVLAVLGITYERMRAKAVKLLGPTAVAIIEKVVEYVKALIQGGPAALWEKVKEDLGNLKQMVIDAIQEWLITTIIKKAVLKLVSMFNPVGAIIQAIMAIYDTVVFIVEKAQQILAFIEAVVNSVAAIAAGAIDGAATWIENALAKAIPLVIGFLAQLLGLGGISKKIKEIIEKIQNFVDKAIDKAIAKIVGVVKKLFGAVKAGVAGIVAWWKMKVNVKADDESHQLHFRGEQQNAEVVIASSPMALEDFLKDREKSATNDQRKLISKIRNKLEGVKKLIKHSKSAEPNEDLQKNIEKDMNALGADLVQLLSTGEMGSKNSPAPLDYEKRTSAAYPVFYLAVGKAKGLKQGTLKERISQDEYKGTIFRYSPTGAAKTPGNEETFGLGAASHIEVGRKIEFGEKGTRGTGVKRFKELIGKYGLTANEYHWDIDHVVELQIGGQDVFENLWPLPYGENRSSGSIIKSAKVKGTGTAVGDLHEEKKKKKKSLWLIITSTRQR